MTRYVFLATTRALAHAQSRAGLVGLLLGGLVWAMSELRPGDVFSLSMATVMVVAGSLAFVCHAASRTPASALQVRGWLLSIGCGLLAALAALNWV